VIGIGVISAQTPVPDGGTAGPFARWDGVDPAAELEARLGVPTSAERAAIAGAVAEHRFGAGRSRSDLMYVRLSAGCGLGFIMDGVPYRGASGIAGEVAHVPLTVGRRPCYCGRQGCLETIAGSDAVAGIFSEVLGESITVSRMLELVSAGDRRARQLIAEAGGLIGRALAPAVSLMNPAACIIGGDLSVAGETLLTPIRREIARHATPVSSFAVSVVTSQLGYEAEALGAAMMQLSRAPTVLARRAAPSAANAEAG
jgi:predicted NBD/HSP70 family sugar kinase